MIVIEPTISVEIRIAYGDTPTSYGELSIPGGPGPFPVAMDEMLHGGCWLASRGAMEDYRLNLRWPRRCSAW